MFKINLEKYSCTIQWDLVTIYATRSLKNFLCIVPQWTYCEVCDIFPDFTLNENIEGKSS